MFCNMPTLTLEDRLQTGSASGIAVARVLATPFIGKNHMFVLRVRDITYVRPPHFV